MKLQAHWNLIELNLEFSTWQFMVNLGFVVDNNSSKGISLLSYFNYFFLYCNTKIVKLKELFYAFISMCL